MIFFDTETVGLHGPIVLLQYAEGVEGEIHLHSVWKESIGSTLDILDKIIYDPDGIVGFNLVFDHFHICQMYTTLILIPNERWDDPPDPEEYALLEPQARLGPCIKPTKACDLMLVARRGPYQSTMDRGDIRIKKVPTPLAWQLADELERRIVLKDIYFARKKDQSVKHWQVLDIKGSDGKINPDFKDLILKFAASSALKALATDALDLDPDEVLKFKDIDPPKSSYPTELGYAPYALSIGDKNDWKGAWPEKLRFHVDHWAYHAKARIYAAKDVEYCQRLWQHFGCPELGDDDSELACMVAAVRWRGFAVDLVGLKKLRDATVKRNIKILTPEEAKGKYLLDNVPGKPGYKYFKIPTAPHTARNYIKEAMSEFERMIEDNDKLASTTKRTVLEDIVKSDKWWLDCPSCKGIECKECKGTGKILHPVQIRCKEVLDARQAAYEADFYDKLLLAGRFHASSSVIGSLSSRMSGGGSARGIEQGGRARGDRLNPQGVKRTKEVRSQFPLADNGLILCGGDFSGFEVCLAEAVYNDPGLRADLQSKRTCSVCSGSLKAIPHPCKGKGCKYCTGDGVTCGECGGKGKVSTKIHALFGMGLFPDMTYDEIVRSAGTANDCYEKSKRSFFATIYGGNEDTLFNRVGIPIEIGRAALEEFGRRYPGVAKYRQKIFNLFCSMRQPGGIGSVVEWHEPAEYIEAGFGFRRYFTLENQICKALYNLASDPPKDWQDIKIRVVRRDRVQMVSGAVRSALFAAAFALQAHNMRAAANHEIQSFGAQITKRVQRGIWDLQPSGVQEWLVCPLNVHDEIQCPTHPSMMDKVTQSVNQIVESCRPRVPLIKMDWQSNLNSWADKS